MVRTLLVGSKHNPAVRRKSRQPEATCQPKVSRAEKLRLRREEEARLAAEKAEAERIAAEERQEAERLAAEERAEAAPYRPVPPEQRRQAAFGHMEVRVPKGTYYGCFHNRERGFPPASLAQ